jgi:hypothetical protein
LWLSKISSTVFLCFVSYFISSLRISFYHIYNNHIFIISYKLYLFFNIKSSEKSTYFQKKYFFVQFAHFYRSIFVYLNEYIYFRGFRLIIWKKSDIIGYH